MYKSVGLCLLFLILSIYLYANIFSSQQISPLLGKLQKKDFDGTVLYLRSIRNHASFATEFARYKNIYGDRLQTYVFHEAAVRETNIRKLEKLLGKNPQARDVLYQLYVNYKAQGDKTRADAYLKRAQGVDPDINSLPGNQ